MLREAEGFAERLSLAELTVFGVLAPASTRRRSATPSTPTGATAARAASGEPEREGAEPALGPAADESTWSTYRTDSAIHATYWISGWPRIAVGPNFLTPLLARARFGPSR